MFRVRTFHTLMACVWVNALLACSGSDSSSTDPVVSPEVGGDSSSSDSAGSDTSVADTAPTKDGAADGASDARGDGAGDGAGGDGAGETDKDGGVDAADGAPDAVGTDTDAGAMIDSADKCAAVTCAAGAKCCPSTGACYDPKCLACCMAMATP